MADVADNPPSPSEAPATLFKKRNAKSKSNIRKRPATPPPADSDSDNDSDYTSAEDEAGHKIKRRRKGGVTVTQAASRRPDLESYQATKFAGDASSTIQTSNDATKQSNWYDESADGALSAKQLLGTTRSTQDAQAQTSDGTYKGASNYQSYIQKNPNAPSRQVGPIKAPTNIRTVTVTDFAPDVCKDYKQTGFCGFGDSCKFLHAREDYKQGWQLDREWDVGGKNKGKPAADASDKTQDAEEKMLENIPFACIICKQPYKNPVVTKCGHYFCEKCALERYKKSPSCAACGASTNGVFNVAGNLKKLLQKKAEREKVKNASEADGVDD